MIYTCLLEVEVLIVLHLLVLVLIQVWWNFCNVCQQVVINVGLVVTCFDFFFLLISESFEFVWLHLVQRCFDVVFPRIATFTTRSIHFSIVIFECRAIVSLRLLNRRYIRLFSDHGLGHEIEYVKLWLRCNFYLFLFFCEVHFHFIIILQWHKKRAHL